MKSIKELEYHSSSPASAVLQSFNEARKTGIFCDAVLKADEDNRFSVHRALLSFTSDYFKEALAAGEGDEIEINDVNAEDLDLILKFLYTGEIKIPFSQVKSILHACKTFNLGSLGEACERFLEEHFVEENVFHLREFAMQESHWSLCSKVDAYLKENFHLLYQRKDFLLLPRLQVTLIASRNCSNQDFDHMPSLFMKVIDWVQKRQQEYGEKLSSLLEESNMLYLQSNQLLKDCVFDDIEEQLDVNSNEDIKKFRRQTSRCKSEMFIQDSIDGGFSRRGSHSTNEYKLIVEVQNSDQNAIGLAVIDGQLIAISLHYKTRHGSSNASTVSSDSSGCEDNVMNNSLVMLAPMVTGHVEALVLHFLALGRINEKSSKMFSVIMTARPLAIPWLKTSMAVVGDIRKT
eukprot:gene16080-17703_t